MKYLFCVTDYGDLESAPKLYQVEADSEKEAKQTFVEKAFPLLSKDSIDWDWILSTMKTPELEVTYIGNADPIEL